VTNPFTLAAERHFAPASAADPVGWATKKGIHLWSKQREVLESIRDNRYTAVPACHDSGKSFGMAVAGANHLEENSVGDAFLVSTAPSVPQVDAILWREIRKLRRTLGLRGRIIGGGYPQWLVGDELIGYGRKPQDYDQTAFQGIHAPKVLVVIDEADGVPKDLFDAADTLATNEYARVVAIGNPDDPESHFSTICEPGSGWNVIRIDGLQTPNFNEAALKRYPELAELFLQEGLLPVSEPVPEALRVGLLSPLWVVERMQRWGTDTALWESKVRGRFPKESSKRVVIPLGWIEAAIQRWYDWDLRGRPEVPGARVLGLDVAREGPDDSALCIRRGSVIESVESVHIDDTTVLSDWTEAFMTVPGTTTVVDVVGVGGGVFDTLRRRGYSVTGFSAGEKTDAKDLSGKMKFADAISAAWWKLREALMPQRNPTLAIPPHEGLKLQLSARRYKVQGNVIRIEPKEELAKRLKRSPDEADAVVMSWSGGSHGGRSETSLADLSSGWKTGANSLASGWGPTHWETEGSLLSTLREEYP
jgi:hypothetical protein